MTRLLTLSFVIVAMGGTGLAQTSSTWTDQWFRAKYGRNSPASEVRVHSDNTGTAYREVATHDAARHTSNWFEQWYRAKHGRNSPAEEARLHAERTDTAYREDTSLTARPAAAPRTDEWFREFYKAKYGRDYPRSRSPPQAEYK